MKDNTVDRRLRSAVFAGNLAEVRSLLSQHPHLKGEASNRCLRIAARDGNVEMMTLLVDLGADVNAPESDRVPEGAIESAAGAGAIDAVRWLLEKGARVNVEVKGVVRCISLTGAVIRGHFDIVKLLVEQGGADVNACWAGQNALSFAMMYGHKEIEAYLRKRGALEPKDLGVDSPLMEADPILDHVRKHLGNPEPLSLQEILPCSPSITIHVVRMEDCLALVTRGMSDQPMTVPEGAEVFRFAELTIYLPLDWPLGKQALDDPQYFWPFEWLRRIALYPHQSGTWIGGPVAVFSNGEPPAALGPNTQMTCFLAILEPGDMRRLEHPDGRSILFYKLFPLYTEERDLHEREGTERLLTLFAEHQLEDRVEIARPNVAKGTLGL